MAGTYVFFSPDGMRLHSVEGKSRNEALEEANRLFVWSGFIPNFYAWNDERHPGEFYAMTGVWD